MKILIRIVIASSILGVASWVIIQVPSVQDRILVAAFTAIGSAGDNLPKEDALSAAVCGSRSPLPSPGRAETCILVAAGDDLFVVDIGDGSNQNLRSWNIDFSDIQAVLITHLHSDHCGWNTRLVDGKWEPTFPNAKYVISREEYLDTEQEGTSIFTDNVLPVAQAGQVQLVDLDYRLDDQVWLEPTVGHSAGHVAVHLRSKNRHAIMCGDLIHSPLQLAEPRWNCNSDWNIPKAIETRLTFLNQHCETDRLILTSHFPLPSMGHIVTGHFGFDFDYVDYSCCL